MPGVLIAAALVLAVAVGLAVGPGRTLIGSLLDSEESPATVTAEPTVPHSPTEGPSTPAPSATPSPTVAPEPTVTAVPTEAPPEGPIQLAWAPVRLDAGASIEGVAFVEDRWFALGRVDSVPAIWRSPDGVEWQRAAVESTLAAPEAGAASDVFAVNGTLVAIGHWGVPGEQFAFVAWRSTDGGSTWTESRTNERGIRAATLTETGLLGAGWDYAGTFPFDSWAAISADGVAWRRVDSPAFANAQVMDVTALGPRVVAVGDLGAPHQGAAWYSDDGGETWTAASPPHTEAIPAAVATFGDRLVAVGGIRGSGGGLATPVAWVSDDGANWQQVEMPPTGMPSGLAVTDGHLVAVGVAAGEAHVPGTPVAWTSRDGLVWEEIPAYDGQLRSARIAGGPDGVIVGGSCTEECSAPLWRGDSR